MQKNIIFTLLLLLDFTLGFAQLPQNPYHLPIIADRAAYEKGIQEQPDAALLNLKTEIPDVEIEVKYATKDNFMHRVMYAQAQVFARKIVVQQLKKVQAELRKSNRGLKIFDGYRPYAVTLDFYKDVANRKFVANPKLGSKHNRGCAVDLTIIDYSSKKQLDMGTPYDSFLTASAPYSPNISAEAKKNRLFFIQLMKKYGFNVIRTEWWHFDYKDWKNYPLMDISFEELSK